MKKGSSSESIRKLETTTRRRRKYDEEFKQQALAMIRNGQPVRSVAQLWALAKICFANGNERPGTASLPLYRTASGTVVDARAIFAGHSAAPRCATHDRSRHGRRTSPNLLLEREIKVDRPRQVIVGDITYLPLQNGGAYLATWMDLFSHKIVGTLAAKVRDYGRDLCIAKNS